MLQKDKRTGKLGKWLKKIGQSLTHASKQHDSKAGASAAACQDTGPLTSGAHHHQARDSSRKQGKPGQAAAGLGAQHTYPSGDDDCSQGRARASHSDQSPVLEQPTTARR